MSFGRPSQSEQRARREAERAANMQALMTPSRALHRGNYAGSTTAAAPKGEKAKPGKRTPTVAEREWMDKIVAYGCVACRMDGRGIVAPCVHHILRGGRRMGHLFTLPLCPGHHQDGTGLPGLIARHPYKARFEQRYGSEESLLARLRAEIGTTP
jgi:hypothetical protein